MAQACTQLERKVENQNNKGRKPGPRANFGNHSKMSKKRGLSVEEKRTRIRELFYEKKDFFLLKELEKIAPKEKGTKGY